MKTKLVRIIIVTLIALLGNQRGNCQGSFQNLDFEAANIPDIPSNSFGGTVSLINGMPGWIVNPISIDGSGNQVVAHNTVSLGGAVVAIDGPQWPSVQILEGNYTAFVMGSTFGTPTSAYIAQTGQIPLGSESLQFFESPFANFQVTFGEHPIPVEQIGVGPNYDIMGGDISAYAGQTDELRFTALPNLGGGYLDNIQFSVSPVPEPATLAFFPTGALLLALRRRWIRA